MYIGNTVKVQSCYYDCMAGRLVVGGGSTIHRYVHGHTMYTQCTHTQSLMIWTNSVSIIHIQSKGLKDVVEKTDGTLDFKKTWTERE